MTTEKITNHVDEAIERLASQFQDKSSFRSLLTAAARQVQDLENASFALFDGRGIYHATGATLDALGKVVGRPRPNNGQAAVDDEAYRALILGQAIANVSNGETEQVLSLLRLLGMEQVAIREPGNASSLIEFTGQLVADWMLLKPLVALATGPIRLDFTRFGTDYFGFADDLQAKGFGNANDSATGGYFAEVI